MLVEIMGEKEEHLNEGYMVLVFLMFDVLYENNGYLLLVGWVGSAI